MVLGVMILHFYLIYQILILYNIEVQINKLLHYITYMLIKIKTSIQNTHNNRYPEIQVQLEPAIKLYVCLCAWVCVWWRWVRMQCVRMCVVRVVCMCAVYRLCVWYVHDACVHGVCTRMRACACNIEKRSLWKLNNLMTIKASDRKNRLFTACTY